MVVSEEWKYMSTLVPPQYPCVRRPGADTSTRMVLDGRLDKDEWEHAQWTDLFVDIEGPARKPNPSQRTRAKMMWDDNYLYVGADMEESRVWGTFTDKNTVMYHENDFEIFIDPDGSRHNYYEFEMNCLNTIWELRLRRPYKDGNSIDNPYNLSDIHSAVYIDGTPNDPSVTCSKWSVEVAIPLRELVQFDERRRRHVQAGDVWRMNFSRVQYDLLVQHGRYVKVPNQREYNFVWAPTGVIDIHRPEKWSFVAFLGATAVDKAMTWQALRAAVDQGLAVEMLLDQVYYDQRAFHDVHARYAATLAELHPTSTGTPSPPPEHPITLECATDLQSYVVVVAARGHVHRMTHDAKYTITSE
ncbi:hypothetical protein H257_14978 [Aphanomyces astaci]|uniref:Carbohydrate-binding domain-containing protein n=2 Tax=Aphanomyces astaci TaxID=112090 RepID=W4FPH6_APHAT|nr:hypothetical protein H257_14978 [Aphanomyces astaci]ETV69375.1 hypothetical protein H257_14978 [Aphanomyces astaci]|eukprot:XP_009841232.1 hypothetical protein H257_14978 [Aphanomyces astaci]